MTKNQKRKISVGFLKPSKLEGDTIYVQLKCKKHEMGGLDHVDCYAISNIPFNQLYEKELVYKYNISSCRGVDENKKYQYQNYLEKFAKINQIEIIENRFEYDGLNLIKLMNSLNRDLASLGKSIVSLNEGLEGLFK